MKKDALKSSFVVGSIALVFLIVGYQVAVFVHSAAVAKIAADRDCPDTVFVAVGDVSGGENFTPGTKTGNAKMPNAYSHGKGVDGRVIERRSGAKSAVGKIVREYVPRRKVESFMFNPNTASVEELQRLGFSLKQAQAIENYRNKGGRFRRKSDLPSHLWFQIRFSGGWNLTSTFRNSTSIWRTRRHSTLCLASVDGSHDR